ncbi:MAG: hypothetical protein ACPGJS_14665 [Flammeovirgaceae bacterium]
MPKPVIFLAFANDRVDNTAYLRNLPKELAGIRNVLLPAIKEELCEVVERANVTISQIIEVFQDERYQNRIAIFHYGGHSNGYQLLLENLEGEHASAHSEGLVSFLAKQRSLQTVFLNGCSSSQYALDLLSAGLPAVIGTSQSINDDIATMLAIRFYGGLAKGYSIQKAWGDAVDEVKIHKGTANLRDLFWEEMSAEPSADTSIQAKNLSPTNPPDRFPWEIHFKEGAEIVKKWSLPEAAANPLFGLPKPPSLHLPEQPYRFLERYDRNHAEVFFGRSYYIRELFQRTVDPNAAPILLFYGQSGVGKSSMLDAGLFPRLEQVCEVIYLRRDAQKGLINSLRAALGGSDVQQAYTTDQEKDIRIEQLKNLLPILSGEAADNVQRAIDVLESAVVVSQHETQEVEVVELKTLWLNKEEQAKRPLVVLLDQVEEAYTKPNPEIEHELEWSLAALFDVFGDPRSKPQGKLILSYRKEYHPEIEEGIKKLQLPRENIFLRKLEKRDIIEVVKGLVSTEALRKRYCLEIEPELPEVIADDLLEDRDSPIAPVLQILLTKMWRLSEKEETRVFSVEKYQQLKKQGILMDDFFREQMELLKSALPELEKSGLALDVLYFHTTKLATADVHNLEELRERYGAERTEVDDLLQLCKDLYLLTDAGMGMSGLAHDTLAPIIQKEFRQSDKPGQRASIILENKLASYTHNEESLIDEEDLKIVETGAAGMRIWLKKEEELIEKSREKALKAQRFRRNVRKLGSVATILIIIVSILATYATYKLYKKGKADSFAQLAQLFKTTGQDNLAFSLFNLAYKEYKHSGFKRQAFKVYRENRLEFPVHDIPSEEPAILLKPQQMHYYASTEQGVGYYDIQDTAQLDSWNIKQHIVALKHAGEDRAWAISKDGSIYLLAPNTALQAIGKLPSTGRVVACESAPDQKAIAVATDAKKVYVWEEGRSAPSFEMEFPHVASKVRFSKDLAFVAAYFEQDSTFNIWDTRTYALRYQFKSNVRVTAMAFNPQNHRHLLLAIRGEIQYIDWMTNEVKDRFGKLFCSNLKFRPSGKRFIASGISQEEWDLEKHQIVKTYQTSGHFADVASSDVFLLYNINGEITLSFPAEHYVDQVNDSLFLSVSFMAVTNQPNVFFVQRLSQKDFFLVDIESGHMEEVGNVPPEIKQESVRFFQHDPTRNVIYVAVHKDDGTGKSKHIVACYDYNEKKWLWERDNLGRFLGLAINGNLIMLPQDRTTIKLLNPVHLKEEQVIVLKDGLDFNEYDVTVSVDGNYLFIRPSITEDEIMCIYNIPTGSLVYQESFLNTAEGQLSNNYYSFRKAIQADAHGEISLYDFADKASVKSLSKLEEGGILTINAIDASGFDPTGRYFYIISLDAVKVWDLDLQTEEAYPLVVGDIYGIRPAYLAPNAEYLLYSSISKGLIKQQLHPYTFNKQFEAASYGGEDPGGLGLFLWYMLSLIQENEINVELKPEWVEVLDELTPAEDDLAAAIGIIMIFGIFVTVFHFGRKWYKRNKKSAVEKVQTVS